MYVKVPYNVERIILMASELDTARVSGLMAKFESDTKTMIPADLLTRIQEVVVDTLMVESPLMVDTMKRVDEDNGGRYTICPHTAVGVAYYYQSLPRPSVVLATAAPDKFPEAVQKAGIQMKTNPEIEKLFSMETRWSFVYYFWILDLILSSRSIPMKQGENWEQMLREKIESITKLRN